MFKVTKYPHGTFSWADCSSTDQPKGKEFYRELMGWENEDLPLGEMGFYTMFQKDGETVAAIGPMMPDLRANGVPSHWSNYVTVYNIDELAEKVPELGGTVVAEPFDVFDSGRMAVIQDPTGANIGLWQPQNHIGASLVNTIGAMCWNELATRDPETARKFYGELLGWEFQKSEDADYWMIINNGRMNGGIIRMTEEWDASIPPHWLAYFTVEDVDAAVEKVKELGGEIHVPPMETSAGRFATVSDPQGAALALIETTKPDPWQE